MSTSTIPELDDWEQYHLLVLIDSMSREGRSEREIEAAVRARTGDPARSRNRPRLSLRLKTWARGLPLKPQIDRA